MHHHNPEGADVLVDTSEHAARAKVLRVTPQLLAAFCQSCQSHAITRAVKHALPEDAQVSRWFIDDKGGYINLVITSASFGIVPDGNEIPWLDPPPVIGIHYAERQPNQGHVRA